MVMTPLQLSANGCEVSASRASECILIGLDSMLSKFSPKPLYI